MGMEHEIIRIQFMMTHSGYEPPIAYDVIKYILQHRIINGLCLEHIRLWQEYRNFKMLYFVKSHLKSGERNTQCLCDGVDSLHRAFWRSYIHPIESKTTRVVSKITHWRYFQYDFEIKISHLRV